MTTVKATGAKEFKGSASLPLLPFQGPTFGTIRNAAEGKSGTGNVTLVLTVSCDEEPTAKGILLEKSVPMTGMTRGDNPRPNIEQYYQLMTSTYTAVDTEAAALAKVQGLDNQDLIVTEVAKKLIGAKVWYTVVAKVLDRGGVVSNVDRFITRQSFEGKRQENGQHHTANPAVSPAGNGLTQARQGAF